MKASSGSSRSATVDRAQTAADGAPGLDDGETSAARTLHCKETLFSSSDTDDGDASYSKLVIDLDASGAGADRIAVDAKQPTTSSSCSAASEAVPMSTSCRADGGP